jgi:hypothetical protein
MESFLKRWILVKVLGSDRFYGDLEDMWIIEKIED